jgi:DnaJ-class molecular chaperone
VKAKQASKQAKRKLNTHVKVGKTMRDAHKILSVGRNATVQEIKLAYRRLALALHPDTNGGDADKSEQFKKVNDAYSYLTDPKAREDDVFDDFEQVCHVLHTFKIHPLNK